MALKYVGKAVADNPDVVYKDYVGQVKNKDKSVAEIDTDIANALSGYATKGYVDAGDAKNATKDYVDGLNNANPNGGDLIRLPLSAKNLANGSVSLDATGKIPTSRINAVGQLPQKWVRGPWTPPSYPSATQAITTEATVYSCPVKDPGYPYRLIVFGGLDVRSNTQAEYAKFFVRVDDAVNGEIVAAATGPAESSETVTPTSGEKFTTPFATDLGDRWSVTTESGSGGYYNVSGGQANWVDGGQIDHTIRYRRIGTSDTDVTTKTDYQRVRMTIGTPIGERLLLPGVGNPQWVRLCARMNTAEDQWVGFELDHTTFTMKYCVGGVVSTIPQNGGGWVTTGSSISTDPATGSFDILAGTVNSLRQFYFYRNGTLIGQALDGNGVSGLGTGNRGWGWYGHASARGVQPAGGQTTPPSIAELLITDAAPSTHHVSLVPANVGGGTVRYGDITIYVRAVRSGVTSTQSVFPDNPNLKAKPNLTVFAVPA